MVEKETKIQPVPPKKRDTIPEPAKIANSSNSVKYAPKPSVPQVSLSNMERKPSYTPPKTENRSSGYSSSYSSSRSSSSYSHSGSSRSSSRSRR